ncbi:protein kinase-like (PK-like) protein [Colletotrichum musicola]|uniref:Protein kinase-like (PK-like) protein n=1 Tax=Colletotrichum musicola TaxID=2175873 RepID=A0A8H6JYP6_9PEZI|nr:protein kinase-like (PK-like) protein [Colletotrichum musicola]
MLRTERKSKAVRFLGRLKSLKLRQAGGSHVSQASALERPPPSNLNGEPKSTDDQSSSPAVVTDIIMPQAPEQDMNSTDIERSQSAVFESRIDTSFSGSQFDNGPSISDHDAGGEDPLAGPQTPAPRRRPRESSGELYPPPSSVVRSSTAITDSAPKPNSDGGRDYESAYLRARYTRQSSSSGVPASPGRVYTGPEVLSQVLNDLTKNSTVVYSALDTNRKFVPCTVLHDIMTFETVEMILGELFSKVEWTDRDVQRIAPKDRGKTGLRRIFAILIIIEKHKDILHLLQFNTSPGPDVTGLDDTHLPVLDDAAFPDPTGVKSPLQAFFDEQKWLDRHQNRFREVQWELMPVFFGNEGGHDVHYQCRSGDILPLIKHKDGILKSGAFGEVTSYRLHEDQQSLKRYTTKGAKHPIVVKKPYRLTSRDEFDEEIQVLRRLTRSRHGQNHHLAKLLATFEVPKNPGGAKGMDYYMMFEWADKTLHDLFREPRPLEDACSQPELHEWAAEQVLGLATALRAMHKLERAVDDFDDKTRGIHGDLKPPNILVYRNWNYPESDGDGSCEGGLSGARKRSDGLGILQITDFGRSSFHHTLTVEDIKFTAVGGDYCPPELQLRLSISPSLDIWTLGCLYLEIMTWLLEGPEGIKEFRLRRYETPGLLCETHPCFYSVRGRDDEEGIHISVSEAALQWATRLYDSENGSDFTRALLKLVLGHMLVIEDKNNGRQFMSVPDQRLKNATPGVDTSANRISTKDFGGVPGTLENPPPSLRARQITRISAKEVVEQLQKIRKGEGGGRSGYYTASEAKEPHDFYKLPRNAIYSPGSFTKLVDDVKAERAEEMKKHHMAHNV